jgi:DNA-binding CsgD family transcriptional regulator
VLKETEPLLRLIETIYDAAIDSGQWPTVLEKSAEFVGGAAAALFLKDLAQHSQTDVFTWGYDPEFIKSYNETYIHLDPFSVGQFLFKVGDVISLADLMPPAKFRRTRFYKEWVQPQHWADAIGTTLEKSLSAYGAFSIIRHERDGLADDKSRERMGMLVPHLRRSVTIGRMMDLSRGRAEALAETLDGLEAAVFLVDVIGRVVHANKQAQDMTAQSQIVRKSKERLVIQNPEAHGELLQILRGLEAGLTTPSGNLPVLHLATGGADRYLADVLPLTAGARRGAGKLHSAVAAVFLRKASMDLPHPVDALARAYKLTRAEIGVLMGVVNVGRASDVAEVLGISEATVRAHLKKIFYKTDVTRQVDLARIVASFTGPLTSTKSISAPAS